MTRFFLIILVTIACASLGWYALQYTAGGSAFPGGVPVFPSYSSYEYDNASEDSIFITSPKPGETLAQTIIVKGFARGTWYFEASFPIVVENDTGMVIGEGYGTAEAEWMTESFVPFTAQVDLKTPYTGSVKIILKKDNPSGDPIRDASVSFPAVIE